jgi:hypothetical protein
MLLSINLAVEKERRKYELSVRYYMSTYQPQQVTWRASSSLKRRA